MSNSQNPPPTVIPSGENPAFQPGDRFILGIVLGVLTFWLFAQSMVNIAPEIQTSLGLSSTALNLALSATPLFCGCFIVVAGGLADRFGLMRFTRLGFILSIIGSLCLILANGSTLLITGRIIQGLSGACIMPATLALVKLYYQDAARQRAISFWSIGSWGGSGLCSLVGGAIATSLGWRWVFIFSVIVAIVGMLLIRGIPEHKTVSDTRRSAFDLSGVALFVVFLLGLNLLISGSFSGGVSAGLWLICLCTLSCFIWTERVKKSTAFIDFSLFRSLRYSGATVSNFMLNAVAGTLLVTNTYIQEGRGFSSFESGMLTIGYLIAVLLMIRIGEKILQRMGARKPMLYGTLLTGCGVAMMALTFLSDSSYIVTVVIGYILFGLGLGCYATPSTDTAVSAAPEGKTGTASGIYKMASSLGGAFGIAISGAVYSALKSGGVSIEAAAVGGLLVNIGFCLLAVFAVWLMIPPLAGRFQQRP